MAVVTPDLGYGTTVAFATSSFAAAVRSINLSGESREVINASDLSTDTTHKKLLEDLYDPGGFDAEIIWDSDEIPPIGGAEETATITLPDGTTLIGKAGLTQNDGPSIEIAGLMTAAVHWEWTGWDSAGTGAGPDWSAAA